MSAKMKTKPRAKSKAKPIPKAAKKGYMINLKSKKVQIIGVAALVCAFLIL